MVFAGEDERAGRWSGTGKIECGIQPEAGAGAGAANGVVDAASAAESGTAPVGVPSNTDAAAVTGG
jgi:hypothetical protein